MPTHTGPCVVCGEKTYCSEDTHALGAGRGSYCRDADGPAIEFCSLACFMELVRRMEERWRVTSRLDQANGLDGTDGWLLLGIPRVTFPPNLPGNAPWTADEIAAGRLASSPFNMRP